MTTETADPCEHVRLLLQQTEEEIAQCNETLTTFDIPDDIKAEAQAALRFLLPRREAQREELFACEREHAETAPPTA